MSVVASWIYTVGSWKITFRSVTVSLLTGCACTAITSLSPATDPAALMAAQRGSSSSACRARAAHSSATTGPFPSPSMAVIAHP